MLSQEDYNRLTAQTPSNSTVTSRPTVTTRRPTIVPQPSRPTVRPRVIPQSNIVSQPRVTASALSVSDASPNAQVKDFLYQYEPQDSPHFQRYITGKYEFRQLASDVREPIPKRGDKFKHQELVLRFMKAYDRLLMIHDTGTGKTCSALGPAESFKREWIDASIDYTQTYLNGQPGNINQVIIFTKSETLEKEFRQQLVCKCTSYETYEQKIERTRPGKGATKAITNRLKSFYKFEHYRSFGNRISKQTKEGTKIALKELYANSLIICDEIQDLITGDRDVSQEEKEDDKSAYAALYTLFHEVPDIKVMLMSATPMIDKANEIIPVMNLILPLNQQLSTSLNLNTVTLEQLEPYFRGKISFVRGLDTGAVVEYQGQDVAKGYHTVVYPSQITGIQKQVYEQVTNQRDSFESASRQASMFVFPDGSHGITGFKRYIKPKVGGWYEWINDSILLEQGITPLISNIRDTNDLKQYSAKYATMIQLINEQPGSHFAYFDFVQVGTNLFGMLLELFGFERYVGNESSFNKTSEGGKIKYCSASSDEGSINIRPKIRYAVITSETSEKSRANILELMNSPLNIDGDYIKVLLVSEVGKTGINVNNIRTGHLAGPAWNYSNTYQALSRFIRATSHVNLVEREAERLGIPISEVKVPVHIYQHCIVDPSDAMDTIDISMYKASETKDHSIRRIMRFMKQCAIDCQIHSKRNIRPNDKDGSAVCDYQSCNYVCVDPAPDTIDYSSYNTIYSHDEVNKVIGSIKLFFRENYSTKYEDLIAWLRTRYSHDDKEIKFLTDRALRSLIDRRTVVRDRYNFQSYIQEDGDKLYLQRDFPTTSRDSSLDLYASNIIGVKSSTLDAYVRKFMSQIPLDVEAKINSTTDLIQLFIYLHSLDIDLQAKILENAMMKYCIQYSEDPKYELIIKCYAFDIYWFNEPLKQIEEQKSQISSEKYAKATKAGKGITKKVKLGATAPIPVQGNMVYLHTVRIHQTGGVQYTATATKTKLFNKIRVMRGEDGYFHDIEAYELPIYSDLVVKEKDKYYLKFKQFDIYGIYDTYTNMFRIIDERITISGDKRRENRGKVCKTWPYMDVIDVSAHVGSKRPLIPNISEQQMRQLLHERNLDTSSLSSNEIKYYYAYEYARTDVPGICDNILEKFIEEGALAFE